MSELEINLRSVKFIDRQNVLLVKQLSPVGPEFWCLDQRSAES